MRLLIQRVKRASVSVDGMLHSEIGNGLLALVGIAVDDTDEDIVWLVKKAVQLRIFDDEEGIMNFDVKQVGGDIMAVSQFTLLASTKKGNRPSYIRAATAGLAVPMYEKFVKALEIELGKEVATGIFGANMQVELVNDGPVTIWIDSKDRE